MSKTPSKFSITGELLNGEISIDTPGISASRQGQFCIVKSPESKASSGRPSPESNEIIAVAGDKRNLVHIKWNRKSKRNGHKTGWDIEHIDLTSILGQFWETDRVEAYYQGDQLNIIVTWFDKSKEFYGNNFLWFSGNHLNIQPKIRSWLLKKTKEGWEHLPIEGVDDYTHSFYQFYIDSNKQQSYLTEAQLTPGHESDSKVFFSTYKNKEEIDNPSIKNNLFRIPNSSNPPFQNYIMVGRASIDHEEINELIARTQTPNLLFYATIREHKGEVQTPSFHYNISIPFEDPAGVYVLATEDGTLPIKAKHLLVTSESNYLAYIYQTAAAKPEDSTFQVYILNYEGGMSPKPNIKNIAFGMNSKGYARIFATGENNELWLCRQTGVAPGGKMLFDNGFILLGDEFNSIACPAIMSEDAEVYGVIQETPESQPVLKEVYCAEVNGIWYEEEILIPTEKVVESKTAPFYSTEILVEDENGNIYSDYEVEIRASHRNTFYHEGYLYRTDRYTPVKLKTNKMGKVVIESFARNINGAAYMVHGGFLVNQQKEYEYYNPATPSHRRLAGDEKLTILKGGKYSQEYFGGETLKDQKIVPEKFPDDDAKHLATLIKKGAGTMVEISNKSRLTTHPQTYTIPLSSLQNLPKNDGAFTMDFKTPGKVSIRPSTPEELAVVDNLGGFWHWLSHEAGDAMHAFKHLAHHLEDRIEKVVVSIEKEAKFIIHTIKGEIRSIALTALDEIGDLVESIFVAIAKAVKEVENVVEKIVEFLKMLFEWENILHTKKKIDFLIDEGLDYFRTTFLPKIEHDFIDKAIDSVKKSIDNEFEKIEEVFGGKNFGDFTSSPSSNKQYQSYKHHSVRMNFVNNHFHNSASASSLSLSLPQNDIGKEIMDFIEGRADEFAAKFKSFQNALEKDFKNSSNLLDTGVLAILQASKEVIDYTLDSIKDLLNLMIEIGEEFIKEFKKLLDEGIDFLHWLFELIGIHTPSWKDILSLIIAAPVYLIADLSGDEKLKNILTTDTGVLKGNPFGVDCDTVSDNPIITDFEVVAQAVFSLDYLFFGLGSFAADMINATDEDQTPVPRPLSFFNVFANWLAVITKAPYKVIAKSDYNADDYLTMTQALIGMMKVVWTSGMLIDPKKAKENKTGTIGLISFLYNVNLGCGIANATLTLIDDDKNVEKAIGAVITPIPAASRWLLLTSPDTGLPYIVPTLDIVCDSIVAFTVLLEQPELAK